MSVRCSAGGNRTGREHLDGGLETFSNGISIPFEMYFVFSCGAPEPALRQQNNALGTFETPFPNLSFLGARPRNFRDLHDVFGRLRRERRNIADDTPTRFARNQRAVAKTLLNLPKEHLSCLDHRSLGVLVCHHRDSAVFAPVFHLFLKEAREAASTQDAQRFCVQDF